MTLSKIEEEPGINCKWIVWDAFMKHLIRELFACYFNVTFIENIEVFLSLSSSSLLVITHISSSQNFVTPNNEFIMNECKHRHETLDRVLNNRWKTCRMDVCYAVSLKVCNSHKMFPLNFHSFYMYSLQIQA